MKFVLFFFVFTAALVDSIAGGGALIALPAYYAFGVPPHMALGTNKFASSMGTTMATIRFFRSKSIHYKVALVAAVTAMIGSSIGARMALKVDEKYLQYILLAAVPVIAALVLFKKDFGSTQDTVIEDKKLIPLSAIIGLLIGTYDGFFGPAAGTFYTLAFATFLGLGITKACGTTKAVNLASNLAALATFIVNGKVDFSLAIPCAAFAVAGNWVGSGLAIKKGSQVVRPIMVVAMVLLLVKIAWDLFV